MSTAVVTQDVKLLDRTCHILHPCTLSKFGAVTLCNFSAMRSFTHRSDQGCTGQLQSSTNCGAYQAPLQHKGLARTEHSGDPWPFRAIVL